MTTGRTISPRQVSALQVYAQELEAVKTFNPSVRLTAQGVLRSTQAVLTPREIAILKVVVVGGRSIADVARGAGRSGAEIEELFLLASTKLADHYQTRVSALS